MANGSDSAPLLFLTTSDGAAPTGRNARAQSRASSAKQSNPAVAHYGTFNTFALAGKRKNVPEASSTTTTTTDLNDICRPPKKRRIAPSSSSSSSRSTRIVPTPCPGRSSRATQPPAIYWERINHEKPPLCILGVHLSSACTSLPLHLDLDNVLKVAAFHIRRKAAQLLDNRPDRTLDALRCRQWGAVSAKLASLGQSPYLDGAIACVVSKVQQVVSGAASEERVLVCYSDALHLLRAAVQDPAVHDRLDMLAASQLLAVYEMLDSPDSSSWSRHIAGVAAMAKLQGRQHRNSEITTEQAAPMFVEALLSEDDSYFESKQWKALLQILTIKQSLNPEATGETLSCFRALRTLFATCKVATRDELKWTVRFDMLAKAHELRAHLKNVVVRSEHRFLTRQQTSKGCDVLGLCLVSIMMLDRLILTLRQTTTWQGHNLEVDTQELCTQVIRHELNTAETFPAKDLLQAFQQQHDYPLLPLYDNLK